jgi:hypothetical protein
VTGRSIAALATLAGCMAAAYDARAVDVAAMAGLGLGRWDYWSSDAHSATTIPDWQLTANLSGQPFRPGLLDWQAGASYMGLHDYAPGQNGSRSAWGYRLSSALLSSSNFPINLSAARTTTSFATDITSNGTGAGGTQTGNTETSVLNGSVVLRAPSYPTLRLSSSWVDSTNTPMGGVATTLDTRMINAGLAQSTGNHTYAVDYSSTWNTGNYTLNNYRSDYMNAQFITTPRPDLMFRIREYYVLRSPTNDAALNPRYDDNMVSAGVLYRPGQRWSSNLDYDYRHSLVTATGAPTTEQTSHGLTETTNFRYRPNLYFYGTGNVAYTDEQLQGQPVHASNQNLGGGGNWQYSRGRTTVLSAGNGQLAALEMTDKPFTLGYGVGGSEGINHAREHASLSLSYNIAYSSNTGGIGGSSLVQSVYGSADGLVGRSLQLRSTLNYSQTHRTDPLLGDFNNYTASLLLRAAYRRSREFFGADLTLGESEGVSAAVGLPTGSPGAPVLSSAYNTRSRFATFQATQTMSRGKLSLVEVGRLMSIEMPQQPKQYEESVWVTLRYTMGAMYLTLEDRLSRGGTSGPAQTSNLLMLRLTRGFGGHF